MAASVKRSPSVEIVRAISDSVVYKVGQRVLVSGGYAMDPVWLGGGQGYVGTIVDLVDKQAVVELDAELELHAAGEPWRDFGDGTSSQAVDRAAVRGRWLVLTLGYVGARWEDPIERVHVGLCAQRPDLAAAQQGGRVGADLGAWVESHATMTHASSPKH